MDAITYLTNKHRLMESLLDDLEDASDPDERTRLLNEITSELARHMAIEERVLFPAVREELGPEDPHAFGDEVLEKLEEHHVLKVVLDELLGMEPTNHRFPAKVEVLHETVEHHHEEEEEDLFPSMREAWPESRLEELGLELEEAESSAPTRPHPHLPDEGRFVAMAQEFAATIDQARDAARKVREAVQER